MTKEFRDFILTLHCKGLSYMDIEHGIAIWKAHKNGMGLRKIEEHFCMPRRSGMGAYRIFRWWNKLLGVSSKLRQKKAEQLSGSPNFL